MLHKLFSLTGIVPVGAFLVVHLWTYGTAIQGREAFEEAIGDASGLAYLLFIEALFIWLPLVFHGLYGLRLTFKGRSNVALYPNFANWIYVLQRATGVLVFGFLIYHFWQFRLPLLQGKMLREDLFGELCASLSATTAAGIPAVALAYLTGVAAAAFHLATGLYGFCFSFGITVTRRASRVASVLFGLFGILLFAIGANSVIFFATGSRLILALDEGRPVERVTCSNLARTGDQSDLQRK